MSDTIQKYKDYVMTGFMKSVVPIVIDKASGAVVTDINGREYLDCFAGISVVNAGHCNPHVIAAAKAQMEKLVHCSSYIYHVQPVADLAEKIAHIAPRGLTMTFFGNGGAEAIEGAMKLARLYTGKHEFIALHASFHGRSWGALSVTGNMGRKKRGGPYAPGVTFAPAPYSYRSQWRNSPEECGPQCAQAIEDVIRFTTSGDVAAFIAEPVMGEGGIIVPPGNYFKEVKKVLDRHGILFIADEVQSGRALAIHPPPRKPPQSAAPTHPAEPPGMIKPVEIPLLDRPHQRRAFHQIVARRRKESSLRNRPPPVSRPPHALQRHRNRPRRIDLHRQIDRPHINSQLERGCRHQHPHLPSFNFFSAASRNLRDKLRDAPRHSPRPCARPTDAHMRSAIRRVFTNTSVDRCCPTNATSRS